MTIGAHAGSPFASVDSFCTGTRTPLASQRRRLRGAYRDDLGDRPALFERADRIDTVQVLRRVVEWHRLGWVTDSPAD